MPPCCCPDLVHAQQVGKEGGQHEEAEQRAVPRRIQPMEVSEQNERNTEPDPQSPCWVWNQDSQRCAHRVILVRRRG
jgi:hypothetical protein